MAVCETLGANTPSFPPTEGFSTKDTNDNEVLRLVFGTGCVLPHILKISLIWYLFGQSTQFFQLGGYLREAKIL